jgi:hypothetical protein
VAIAIAINDPHTTTGQRTKVKTTAIALSPRITTCQSPGWGIVPLDYDRILVQQLQFKTQMKGRPNPQFYAITSREQTAEGTVVVPFLAEHASFVLNCRVAFEIGHSLSLHCYSMDRYPIQWEFHRVLKVPTLPHYISKAPFLHMEDCNTLQLQNG